MEKAVGSLRKIELSESLLFLIRSGLLLGFSGVILYLLLFTTYAPVHDTLHHFRHSLAIVPCH
ncbi:MAG: CbtB-domain containing protein [Deltaproteobacteria bacterium]|nr:CbtB-domain containing protein [Deltaproteobacteria bacterium]